MKPEDCIFYQIAKINQAAMRFFNSRISKYDVTAVQAMVLLFLLDRDGVTSKDLGSRVLLDSATLTGVIDRLSAMGLAAREQNPDDRRAILINLTDKGRDLAKKLAREAIKANKEFLADLEGAEEQTLRSVISGLRERTLEDRA